MKRLQPHHKNVFGSLIAMLSMAMMLCAVRPAAAFTSVQTQTLGAVAVMGGPSPIDFEIRHQALQGVSFITGQAIIQGEIIKNTAPPALIPFTSRRTQFTEPLPIEERRFRIRIQYRIIPANTAPEDPLPPVKTLGPVDGEDPYLFAFEIPKSEFVEGRLQYRIEVSALRLQSSALVEGAKNTLPVITSENPEPWFETSVVAQAAQVIGAAGGTVVLTDGNPNDGESSISVPAGAIQSPTVVTLDEVPSGSGLLPSLFPGGLRYYQGTTDQPVQGLSQISLLYPDFQFPQGADGIVDGTDIPVQNLAMFVWDGFKWRRLGSIIDPRTNSIRAKIPYFGFFAIAAAAPLTAEGRRPDQKIVTPNGDGVNDEAFFTVANLTENYKIEIFDINGRRVKTIMTGSSQSWDGRNDSGDVVESGVYIYQYEADGKRISGFIAVAK